MTDLPARPAGRGFVSRARRWWWAPALLGVGAWAWLHYGKAAPPPPPPTATAELADVEQLVQAAGVVLAKLKVDVGAQVTGQVRSLHVQLGQSVKKGELLVSLDPELARNDVQQAEASLSQQEATLDSRRIDLAQAQREAERQRKLLAGEATTRAEAEKAIADVARLESELRGLGAAAGKLRADLASAKLRLGYTQILAPTDGDVVSIAVQEGQTVNAQQQSPTLLTLAKLDTVTIKAQVAEADVRHIRVGQEASFVTLGDSEQRHQGLVRLIQPLPEKLSNAVFYNVLFDVPNPRRPGSNEANGLAPRMLMSDMSVQVNLRVAQASKALTIPMAALGDKAPDGRYTVHLPPGADGKPQPRQVKVGINEAAKVQVLDGLKVGDKVLLAPAAASGPTP